MYFVSGPFVPFWGNSSRFLDNLFCFRSNNLFLGPVMCLIRASGRCDLFFPLKAFGRPLTKTFKEPLEGSLKGL